MDVDLNGKDKGRRFKVRISRIKGDNPTGHLFKVLLLDNGSVEIGTAATAIGGRLVCFHRPSHSREPIVSQILSDFCLSQESSQKAKHIYRKPYLHIDLPLISGDMGSLYGLALSLSANGFVSLIQTRQKLARQAGAEDDQWIEFFGNNNHPFAQCLRMIVLQKAFQQNLIYRY